MNWEKNSILFKCWNYSNLTETVLLIYYLISTAIWKKYKQLLFLWKYNLHFSENKRNLKLRRLPKLPKPCCLLEAVLEVEDEVCFETVCCCFLLKRGLFTIFVCFFSGRGRGPRRGGPGRGRGSHSPSPSASPHGSKPQTPQTPQTPSKMVQGGPPQQAGSPKPAEATPAPAVAAAAATQPPPAAADQVQPPAAAAAAAPAPAAAGPPSSPRMPGPGGPRPGGPMGPQQGNSIFSQSSTISIGIQIHLIKLCNMYLLTSSP